MSGQRYRTIVADPPWHYDRTGVTFHDASGGTFSGHGLPYGTMALDEIAALPVAEMADPSGAHLYCWTTQKYLEDTFAIVRGWGFAPSATLVWCKAPRGFGMGGTYPSTTEFVVFARKGKCRAKSRANSQWWQWPRGAHSAKPEAFMDIVEQVSPGPYLEMFSRRARLGWDTWGNESLHGGVA